jgi:hypothetical protein
MALNLPYHSRRDEVGGSITEKDWETFTMRLESVIDRVARKRARIIKRRKKKGKKKMPRKTLFKPEKKIDTAKDPLWREIFIDKNQPQEDSDSGSEGEDLFKMFREACNAKGIKINKESLNGGASKKPPGAATKTEIINRSVQPHVLPELKYPSMHPKEKPLDNYLDEMAFQRHMKQEEKKNRENKQNTAGMNLAQLSATKPEVAQHLSMSF